MFRFSQSILVDRAPADVWPFLIDFPKVPTWEGGVLEVRQVSAGGPGVGTELIARRVYAGRETLVECQITDWQEGRAATMSIHGGPLRQASVEYAVEPAGDGQAIVTYTAEGELRSGLKFLTLLVPAMGHGQAKTNLMNLKRLVEAAERTA